MAVTDATCVTGRLAPDEARALLDLALQDLVAQPTSAVLTAGAQFAHQHSGAQFAHQHSGPQSEQPSTVRQANREAIRRASR